ncbi:MAG: helix-turn-helix transcriptional regulator [bacterium]|nr:helix-turn-helix transcriptional regulator [bacterium]
MIKNEREYKITRSQADQFEKALADLAGKQPAHGVHSKFLEIEAAALRSQLSDLREEIAEYESLKAGERSSLPIEAIAEFPRALIQARIAMGMSQEELAAGLGLSKQVIQRYEVTNYAGANVARLDEIASALGVTVHGEAILAKRVASIRDVFKRLESVGLNRNFVLDRLLPSALTAELEEEEGEPTRSLVLRAVGIIARVFDWPASTLLGDQPLTYSSVALGSGRFKLPKNASERKTHAYAAYAHRLAAITLKATAHLEPSPIPNDPKVVRTAVLEAHGALSFESVLRWVWSLGVPVLPLRDSVAFYGACWRESGRNVIVLEQNTSYLARWLSDLLHELYHASVAPDLPERSIVDLNPLDRREDDEEDFANDFSSDVALDNRADELAHMCVADAKGNERFLKRSVVAVAQRESVPADSLANYLAYRLSSQKGKRDWWGTAAALQETEPNPWSIARNVFFENARFDRLSDLERELLSRSLTEVEVQ